MKRFAIAILFLLPGHLPDAARRTAESPGHPKISRGPAFIRRSPPYQPTDTEKEQIQVEAERTGRNYPRTPVARC